LVPIVIFGSIAGIVISSRYFKYKERTQLQETLKSAYDKGQPVGPEILSAMQQGPTSPAAPPPRAWRLNSPERDLRRGVIWTAVALAFLAAGALNYYYDPSNDSTGWMEGVACFPGFIGIGYLVIWALTRKDKSQG
jgi:hypothetical protein